MKKVAILFIGAVLLPSLILAFLAIRSIRDQQMVMERQQTLLYQEVINSLFKDIDTALAEKQRDFTFAVTKLLEGKDARKEAAQFNEQLRKTWPLARVGFVVALEGEVLSPSMFSGSEARRFRLENDQFLCSRETVEVYWNSPKGAINLSKLDQSDYSEKAVYATKSTKNNLPAAEAEFKSLIADANDGTIARYLQNKLNLLFWTRAKTDPQLIYGSLIDIPQLVNDLSKLLKVEPKLKDEIAVGLLDDKSALVAGTHAGLNWERPYLTVEVGDSLPHWKLALILLHPGKINQSVQSIRLTLGLLIAALLLAIGVGTWLIAQDLHRQLALARQKTDFVSNVSHELKTPLTSIRMFSELLQSPSITPAKQHEFLQIIQSESARLTRLINNVLDFSSMERGTRKYNFQPISLLDQVRHTIEAYRPQLELNGFKVEVELPVSNCRIKGDPDALSQALMNLLSNAEKYSGDNKEILITLEAGPVDVRVKVCDRGNGVPKGAEEKIFEQFYRAHDSLSSCIPGSGLGLTLARQIARAHKGDISYQPRPGGGSCFILTLPCHEN